MIIVKHMILIVILVTIFKRKHLMRSDVKFYLVFKA